MANGVSTQIQLPPGYEDATPVAGPLAAQSQPQNNSGVSLPPGYEDAKPVKGPLAQQTSAAPASDDTVWGGIKRGASSVYNAVKGIAPPTNTEAATTIPGKGLGMAEDVATGINNLTGITTVTDSLKNAGHMIDSYEKARASGGSS